MHVTSYQQFQDPQTEIKEGYTLESDFCCSAKPKREAMPQSNPGINDIHFDGTVRQSSKEDGEEEDIGAVSDLSSDGVTYESDVERTNSSTMDDDAEHPSPVQMHNFGHGSNHTQIVTGASNSSRGMSGADIICNRSRKSFSSSSDQRSGSPLGVRPYAHLSSQRSRSRERGDDYYYRRNNRIAADALFSYEYNNLKQSALQRHNRSQSSSQRGGSNGSLNETNPLVDHSVGSWLRFRPYDEPDRKSRFLSRASHAGQTQYVVRGSENISMIPNANGFDPQSYNHIRHPEIVAYEERSQTAADREDSHPTHFQYHHQDIQQIHQPDGRTHDGSSGLMTTVARIDERGRQPHVLPTMIENAEEHDMNRSALNTFEHQAGNNLDDVSFVEDDSNMDHKMPSQEPLMIDMIPKLEGKSEGEANDHSVHLQDESEVNRTSGGLTLSDQDGSLFVVEKGVRNEASNGSKKKISNTTFSSGTMDKHSGSNDSKYETYECCVSHFQGDRSLEIPLFTFARPHMRAFHFAWMSFFVAFFTWFAISPLLNEIKNSLGLTKDQVFASSIYSSGGTIVYRLIAGPLCDR